MRNLTVLSYGYLCYRVNGRRFWTYGRAADEAVALCRTRLTVTFEAWSLWTRRWVVILVRAGPGTTIHARIAA
jgi:hypothetical protein